MAAEEFPKMVPKCYTPYRTGRQPTDLYVSPNGNDKWTGTLPEANAHNSDGPFATLVRARDNLRRIRPPGPVTVWLRGGRYELREPLAFGPDDSGPFSYAAMPGEEPVLDGGRRIGGWREGHINGHAAWVAEVPEARTGGWAFRQLFVNGKRRDRPRWPKTGCFYMEHVPDTPLKGFMAGNISDRFVAGPGHVQAWENLTDADVVAVHYWNEERMPIASFDPATREVRCTRRSVWPLKDDAAPRYARYWVENVKEALTEPGQWYLDRREGRLYYLPLPGEDLATADVVAPRLTQLLRVEGDVEAGRPVIGLTLRGLTFAHTEWELPPGDRAGFEQAAANVPGVIALRGARHCAIEGCRVKHAGHYAVELGEGCQGIRVQGNTFTDLGAGGVKCVGVDDEAPASGRTFGNLIADNEIADGGKVFHSAVGVLVQHAYSNDIVHNHIHHLEYSGVSCGWVWGYGRNPTRDILIARNHIHHIGSGLLSDMGGIYLLGEQPGTVLRENLIHDVRMHNYGGWAIYADEGTSHVVIERNVCYDTDSEGFQLHYGRENVVRNNVFALSRIGQVSLTMVDRGSNAFTFTRNIVLADGAPLLVARNRESLSRRGFQSDLNLFWDLSGGEPYSTDQHRNERNEMVAGRRYTLADLQALGYDRHSVAADPRFADVAKRDFRLPPDSPALPLGIEPVDLSGVGPRPEFASG